jgi:hypothetical protein
MWQRGIEMMTDQSHDNLMRSYELERENEMLKRAYQVLKEFHAIQDKLREENKS